ncbi:helix-turn-helix domain-containing protein [Vibrio sp. 404]|uniref:Helix-turn-helix domain-containing protein n=1 Tax=Vibrio marinisediminis TaxID=2758441 RepID=A0A7W2ITG9_9VIBR|nr:helix-turn-helix domain-containing protein [Vibrio marinisediminis]MBA5762531.1 helix-turn-helix domain-containing protein [Vibrio marinisediminis]
MSITSNEVKLINTLLQKSHTIAELASTMSVSNRHIHNYIANINYYIEHAVCVEKGCATLVMSGEEWAQKIREIPISHYRPLSCERQDYLLDNYLFLSQNRYQQIEKLLAISRPTLKKDLNELSSKLQLSGLSIQYHEGSFSLCGTEKKLRHLMMERINKQVKKIYPEIEFHIATTPLQHHTQSVLSQLFSTLPLKETYIIISNISDAIDGKFPANFIKLMFIYLSVSLHRIQQQQFILQKNNADYLRGTTKYRLVYKQLSLLINEQLEYEHLHLTEYFFSGCEEDNFHENQLRVEMCAMLFIRQLTQTFSLSNNQLSQLHTLLCQYLPSAIYRIKNHVRLHSISRETQHLLNHYQVTVNAIPHCQHWLPEPLRDEEIVQIALFVEQVAQYEEPSKIALDDLLTTVKKHVKQMEYEPLKKALLKQYPMQISDHARADYLQPNWFSPTDVHRTNHTARIVDIAELGALHLANKLGIYYQQVQHPLLNVVSYFNQYLHLGSNVYLYSAQATPATQSSTLQLVLRPSDSESNQSPCYYFFLLHNQSATPHELLFALQQFEQQKHIYEQDLTTHSTIEWITALVNQGLAT